MSLGVLSTLLSAGVLSTLGGTLLLALWCACFVCAGAALVRNWQGGLSATERALDTLLAAMALAIALVSMLALSGLANNVAVSLAALAVGALGLRHGKRAMLDELVAIVAAGLRAIGRSPWLALVALLALATIARGLALPPLAWDGLTYHLTYPATWLKHGGVVPLEGGGCWETYETFPKGSEALFFLAMAPLGRDSVVNLTNVPAWLGLAIAVRACCQRLAASARVQDVCTFVTVACPVFLAYVTPAYAEVPRAFAFTAALSAGLRLVDTRDARQMLPLGLAAGAALSIKLTELAWVPLAGILVLLHARTDARGALRNGALAALACAAIAGPWYAHNVLACGNPIYPSGLPGFSDGARAGSLQALWSMRETSVIAQQSFGRVLDYLLIGPWGAKYPLGPFWIFPAAMVALPALLPIARGQARRLALGLWLVALHMLMVYLLTPYNGWYVDADTRFLGEVLVPALLGVVAVLARAPKWLSWLLGGAAVLITVGYLPWVPTFHHAQPRAPSVWLALCLLLALVGALVAARQPARRRAAIAASVVMLLGAWLLLPTSLQARERDRFAHYRKGYDLHPVPLASKGLWEVVAELPPSRIAFSVSGVDYTEAWFFYPLFAPDLRHTVTYVNIERDERRACLRRGMIRDEPDENAWLNRIEEQRIDYVALRADPIEEKWMRAHPERFRLHTESLGGRLYEVVR